MPEPASPEVEVDPHVDPEVDTGPPEDGDSFPRQYVEQLRAEAADHRTRATRADEAAARLLTATVATAVDGILADPTDLPAEGEYLDDDGWPDPERIAAAARSLVAAKPHLADRRPTDPVDQGPRPEAGTVDLAGMLRGLAG